MAIFFDAPVEPDALTEFVREQPVPRELYFSNLFPVRRLDSNTVDFAEIIRTNRAAQYRSFDGRIHVSERDAGSETRIPLIPLSDSLNMGELERLQLEFARTGGTNQAALARAAYNDAEQLTRNVQNRIELAWGDTLTDGKLTVNEGGYRGETDYGVPADQLVTPATAWSDTANATILDDLIAWWDVASVNLTEGVWRPSRRVLRFVMRNAQIRDAVGTTASRVNLEDLNDLMDSEGLPRFAETVDMQFDVDGVDTRVIPDDRILLTPTDENMGQLGFTAYGVTATALELVDSNQSDMAFEDAPGIVGVVIKEGPPFRQFTFVDAVAMPILQDAKKLLVGDVLV